jgi:nucleotide-binding universal stress UspA family protein
MSETRIDSILLATDYSHRSAPAEELAVDLAVKYEAVLHVVSAIEPIVGVSPDDEELAEFEAFYAKLRQRAESELERRISDWTAKKVVVRQHIEIGPRWKVILDKAANERVDLLVLGRRPFDSSASLGSTSHRVFVGAQRPVLLVPGEES